MPTIPPLPRLFLQRGREEAIKRQHPWVFSGAIVHQEGELQDGDLVEVVTKSGDFLARGHYHDGSIKVRILTFEEKEIDAAFWEEKLRNAYQMRQQLAIDANCYRLIHGEGDGLPGLVIDMYDGVAVVQAHTIGMHRSLDEITEALKIVLGKGLKAVYNKSRETLPGNYAKELANGYLYGEVETPYPVLESGRTFLVDWVTGQKTGFFLDQRENRRMLENYSSGKSVLNAFSYSGGFSIYALSAGATRVVSIDASGKAIALCDENVALNHYEKKNHESITEDVMKYFKTAEETFDVVVLDPPAFAKSMSARHRAVQGYKRLNIEGINRIKPGGMLFTFSCSQVVDRELFYNTIVAACMEVGRKARVLHQLTQGPDHPVNVFHPEGSYLKGLVLRID